MALNLKDYDPALMQGANIGVSVDLTDLVDPNGNEVIELDGVDSAVNYLRVTNAATADPVILSCQGTADRGFEFHNDQSEELLILSATASAVNELTISNAATGGAPDIAASGGDTNIDISLSAKGTGGVLYDKASEIVTATNVITAAETGKVFFLNSATEFASTLPAPAQGLHFRFIVTAAPSGASYTILTDSGDNIIEGSATVNGAAVAAVNEDTITFTDSAAAVGDWVELISDGTSWFVSGQGVAATAIAFTAT